MKNFGVNRRASLAFRLLMVMRVVTLDHDFVDSPQLRSTTLTVLDASPPGFGPVCIAFSKSIATNLNNQVPSSRHRKLWPYNKNMEVI